MLSWKLFSNSLTFKSQGFSSWYNIIRHPKMISKCKFQKALLFFTSSLQVFLYVSNNNNQYFLRAQDMASTKSKHFKWSTQFTLTITSTKPGVSTLIYRQETGFRRDSLPMSVPASKWLSGGLNPGSPIENPLINYDSTLPWKIDKNRCKVYISFYWMNF